MSQEPEGTAQAGVTVDANPSEAANAAVSSLIPAQDRRGVWDVQLNNTGENDIFASVFKDPQGLRVWVPIASGETFEWDAIDMNQQAVVAQEAVAAAPSKADANMYETIRHN